MKSQPWAPASPSLALAIGALLAACAGSTGRAIGTAPATNEVRRLDQAAPAVIVDTHTHFWDEVPGWVREGSFLARPFTFADYEMVAAPLRIGATVWVTTGGPGDNAAFLKQAAANPIVVGFVGALSFSAADFEPQLAALVKDRLFRGVRIGSDVVALAARDSTVLRNLERFAAAALTLDVIAQNPKVADFENIDTLAARLPSLRIVYNHLGEPDLPAPSAAWTAAMKNLGQRPNVYMKLSGLAEHLPAAQTDLQSVERCCKTALDTVFDSFGEDRVIFSSNWPVSAARADLAAVLGAIQRYVAGRNQPELAEKVFTENARRAYALPSP